MMMREQQWGRSNCRHFRIDVCLHQRIYMRAFVNARNESLTLKNDDEGFEQLANVINFPFAGGIFLQ